MTPRVRRQTTLLRAEAAMIVALSVALGNLRLLELPSGGSITFASLPVLAFAAVYGVRAGVLCGVCAGLAHALSGGTVLHPAQFALDYGVGYALLGLAGLARHRDRAALLCATAAATLGQLACFVASGVWFFAPDGASPAAAFTYAAGYNTLTVLPEMALALLVVPALVTAHKAASAATDPGPSPVLRRPPTVARSAVRVERVLAPRPHGPLPGAAGQQRPTQAARPLHPRSVPTFRRGSLFRPASSDPSFASSGTSFASSGTSPSAWRTTRPPRDFAR